MSDVPQDLNRPPPAPGPDPLAAALADLQPAPAELNRDRLMFAAGAASQRPVARLWMLTAGFLAAMGFAAGMYVRPPTVVYVERPAPAPSAATEMPPPTPAAQPAQRADERERFSPAPEVPALGKMPSADADVARWLRVRNDVVAGGLGLLPDPGRNARTSDGLAVPGGVWADHQPPKPAPPPKKKPDTDPPDDD